MIAWRTGVGGGEDNVKINTKIWRTVEKSIPSDLLVFCLSHSGPPKGMMLFILLTPKALTGCGGGVRMKHQLFYSFYP